MVVLCTSYNTLPTPVAVLVLLSKGATMKLEVLELEERVGQQVTPLPKDKYPSLLTCVVSIFICYAFVMTSAVHEYVFT